MSVIVHFLPDRNIQLSEVLNENYESAFNSLYCENAVLNLNNCMEIRKKINSFFISLNVSSVFIWRTEWNYKEQTAT